MRHLRALKKTPHGLQGGGGECYNRKNDSWRKPFIMKRWKWYTAWPVQILEMLVAGALTACTDMLHPAVFAVMSWVVMPLLGMLTACRATRRGLLNYAAWIAPPLCMWLTHYLIWSYSPNPGPVLLCAFVSLVGAAAGEVLNRQKKK